MFSALLNTDLATKQDASTAITIQNIGQQHVKSADSAVDQTARNSADSKQPQITGLVDGKFFVKFTNIPANEIYFQTNGGFEYDLFPPVGYTPYGAIGQFISATTIIITSTSVSSTKVHFNARKLVDGAIFTGSVSQGISVAIFYVK